MEPRIPREMRAVVYRGPNDLRLEQVPVPRIGRNEILVRVATCGVCPTDIKKIQTGSVPPPRILGHETAGTVVRIGSGVTGIRIADRVALHHHVPCGTCHFCVHGDFAQCATYLRTGVTAGFEPAGGGYAEYVKVLPFCLPGVVRIPSRNTFEEGALLEPVNTVLKAVRRLGLHHGDSVVVVGQGPIGLLFNRILALHGQQVFGTDLVGRRRLLGRTWGAADTWDGGDPGLGERIRRRTRGRGADAVVLTVPQEGAFHSAFDLVRRGGRILLFAHTLRGHRTPTDLSTLCVDEKTVLGSYSSDLSLQREVARRVFSRRLDVRPLVTHRFPLERTSEAIALAASASPESLKILVEAQP
ncbi:MAG: alcohol dehydrogenase catalytic domain-containing protein [Verrucomicrobiota bacterium]